MTLLRSDNEQLFTFIALQDGDRPKWYRDKQTARYLQQQGHCLDAPYQTALQLLNRLQTDPHHPEACYWVRVLYCYLQECVWQVSQRLADHRHGYGCSREDYFQTGCSILWQTPLTVLQGFDPTKGHLLNFVSRRLYDRVYEVYYGARQSDWGLLRRASTRRLRQALTLSGYPDRHRCLIVFLVVCWQQLTTGSVAPDSQTLAQISRTYTQSQPQSPPLGERDIEGYLQQAIQALRHYHTPLGHRISLGEEGVEDVATASPTPWEALLNQEQQELLLKITTTLAAALAALDDTKRRIVCLYYCEQVSQGEIARQLGLPGQHTVSRLLERTRSSLAKDLLTAFGQPSPSSASLREVGILINGWLQGCYRTPLLVAPCQSCCRVEQGGHQFVASTYAYPLRRT
ncbi:sigma-70 family RNA polymerase sigma factor [Parathermosynechococcus lividus]